MARGNGERRFYVASAALALPVALSGALSLSFFALYTSRLCPTLSLKGDSAELVTAAAVWGVPHPPGYPLFTLIGHAFAACPFPTSAPLAWRVHLTSAVFHACTVAAVCMATFMLTESLLGAAAAALALGLSRTFLLGSLYAEVFPLNDLFFACLIALGACAARGRSSSATSRALLASRSSHPAGLCLFAACAGLACSHHFMIALGAPALAILVAEPISRTLRDTPHRAARASRAAALSLSFCAPFLVYGLVPWAASRSPALSWGNVHDWASLLRLVTRQDYGGPFSPAHTPSGEPSFIRLIAFGFLVTHSMGVASLALAALGLARELHQRRAIGWSLLLAILVPGPLFACANALGTGSEVALAYFERFTSMCHVPLAIAAGSGVALLQSALGTNRRSAVALGLGVGLWSAYGVLRTRDVDLSADRRGIAFAHDLVLAAPDRSLILLSGDEPGSAALYVCAVERTCGERIVLSPGALFVPWRMAQVRARYPDLVIPWSEGPSLHRAHELAAAAIGDRPVLVYPSLLERDPALKDAFSRRPDHLLFRLWPLAPSSESENGAFLASARAMATGDLCEGCDLLAPIAARPSQDVEIVGAYEAAFENHARAAREEAGLGELADVLGARARELGAVTSQGGGVSRSR